MRAGGDLAAKLFDQPCLTMAACQVASYLSACWKASALAGGRPENQTTRPHPNRILGAHQISCKLLFSTFLSLTSTTSKILYNFVILSSDSKVHNVCRKTSFRRRPAESLLCVGERRKIVTPGRALLSSVKHESLWKVLTMLLDVESHSPRCCRRHWTAIVPSNEAQSPSH